MTLSREDRWLAAWLLAALLLSAALFAVNAVWFGYSGISYFPREAWWIAFAALDLFFFGAWVRSRSPYASFAAVSVAFYTLAAAVMGVLATAVQLSPFQRIDHALARFDAGLGWDTVAVLRWVAERPALRSLLILAYNSTGLQLALAPFPAALAHDRRRLRVLLYGAVYASIAGSLIYYFYPSSGPAGVFDTPDFLPVQRLTHLKFEQVRRAEPVTSLLGGMIAFPSFHVAWSVLVTYAALPTKRLFWTLVALNAVVISSTALLGWHYLVDLPAGVALALGGLWLGELTHRRLS